MAESGTWIWTQPQRRAPAVILGVLILIAGWRACEIRHTSPTRRPRGAQADVLQDRIDPNTASVAAISALPLVGEKKAAEIVAYRQEYVAAHPGQLAFSGPRDLERIKGIGAATVERLTPYLIFPAAPRK